MVCFLTSHVFKALKQRLTEQISVTQKSRKNMKKSSPLVFGTVQKAATGKVQTLIYNG